MDALTKEQAIQIKVRNYATPNTGTARLLCRNATFADCWEFRCANIGLGASQAISLWEVNSGVYTARGSTSGVTYTAGTTWTMRVRASTEYVTGSVDANNGVFQLGYASTQHNTNDMVSFGSFTTSTTQHAYDDLLILPIAGAWDTDMDSF